MTLVRATLVLGLVSALGGVLALGGLYTYYARDLPRLDDFEALVRPGVTRFEAADGQLVGEWYQERRIQLRWENSLATSSSPSSPPRMRASSPTLAWI